MREKDLFKTMDQLHKEHDVEIGLYDVLLVTKNEIFIGLVLM